MKVGVPKEIKTQEYRVGLTPAGVRELVVPAMRCWSRAAPPSGSASMTTHIASRRRGGGAGAEAVFAAPT